MLSPVCVCAVTRLKSELERAEVDSREALLQQQSRTAKEVARLTEQVSESRAERDTLLQEVRRRHDTGEPSG